MMNSKSILIAVLSASAVLASPTKRKPKIPGYGAPTPCSTCIAPPTPGDVVIPPLTPPQDSPPVTPSPPNYNVIPPSPPSPPQYNVIPPSPPVYSAAPPSPPVYSAASPQASIAVLPVQTPTEDCEEVPITTTEDCEEEAPIPTQVYTAVNTVVLPAISTYVATAPVASTVVYVAPEITTTCTAEIAIATAVPTPETNAYTAEPTVEPAPPTSTQLPVASTETAATEAAYQTYVSPATDNNIVSSASRTGVYILAALFPFTLMVVV